ncbi:MAG: sortase [Patescibacteria group bacterium]
MATESKTVQAAAGLVKASRVAYTRKWSFLAVFVLIFFITISVAASFDVLPDAPTANLAAVSAPVVPAAQVVAASAPELPTKVESPSIKLSVSVSDPTSTDVEQLDHALLNGAVRYPTSAKLGENGNVIIFGHSSYLPIVNNKNFKAFDGIQNLKAGDRITVTGSAHTYVYAVESVVKANAAADDSIPLTVSGSKLTLATCNSFGEKSDRFVVTATLVETNSL